VRLRHVQDEFDLRVRFRHVQDDFHVQDDSDLRCVSVRSKTYPSSESVFLLGPGPTRAQRVPYGSVRSSTNQSHTSKLLTISLSLPWISLCFPVVFSVSDTTNTTSQTCRLFSSSLKGFFPCLTQENYCTCGLTVACVSLSVSVSDTKLPHMRNARLHSAIISTFS